MRLYQMQDSGNCYKVRLTAHMLGLPLELVESSQGVITQGVVEPSLDLFERPRGHFVLELFESATVLRWQEATHHAQHLPELDEYAAQPREAHGQALSIAFMNHSPATHPALRDLGQAPLQTVRPEDRPEQQQGAQGAKHSFSSVRETDLGGSSFPRCSRYRP